MKTRNLDFGFELKELSESGTFEGYGSVFGVKDSYDEIVAPGAFAESLSSGKMPALLWQHKSAEPIGIYTGMQEDNIGLRVFGQLAIKTARGAEAYELLKLNAISGLSIGFVTREDSFDKLTGIRTLKKVDLWEVSLVTFPANDAARIQGVKAIEGMESLSEIENYLRDAGGFSRNEAKTIIARVKRSCRVDADDDMTQISETIIRNINILKGN